MSLKAFHIVFITAAVLVAFLFAAWCLLPEQPLGLGRAAAGAASVAFGLGLAGYEAWFLRKTRGLS